MAKSKKQKRLSYILQGNNHFDRAVEYYLDQLRKRKDWQNLEKKLRECKRSGWDNDKLQKVCQWEQKAREQYGYALDKSMEFIKYAANSMSDLQFNELELWIREDKNSKLAWNKNTVSIDDHLLLIKAKMLHLIFMSRSPMPVNIGDIIKNQ